MCRIWGTGDAPRRWVPPDPCAEIYFGIGISLFVCEGESHSVVSDSLQPHRLYSSWNSPGHNTGVGSPSLLQGIFPSQGSNPGLLHCRQIPYELSHKWSPRILEWVAYPFSSGSSQPRNQTGVSCIAGGFFTNGALREDPFLCGDKQKDLVCSLLSQVRLRPPLMDPKQVSVASEKKPWRGPQGDQAELGSFLAAFSASVLFVSTWFAEGKAVRALWVLHVLAPTGRMGHRLTSPV